MTIDNQFAAGLPYTLNNSKWFIRNGQRVSRSVFKIDETSFEARTAQETYIDNLRHLCNYTAEPTKPYKRLKNVCDLVFYHLNINKTMI
jgi:hypothetical protein